jgi:hypothetical protein
LAETERDAGCLADAQDAFVRAIAIYEQLGVAQEISYAKALQERMILREGTVA